MSLTKLTKDLSIISKLSDEPNDTDGLTADELKAKFDEAGNSIKDYLNNTMTSELDAAIEDIDSDIEAIGEAVQESYKKPDGGIPKTDLDSNVQTSLGKADTALQAGALPTGGTDGDVLVKNGTTDYAANWTNTPKLMGNLATIEPTSTVSKPDGYQPGEYLVYNGQLYKVGGTAIGQGETLNPGQGGNINAVDVTSELKTGISAINNRFKTVDFNVPAITASGETAVDIPAVITYPFAIQIVDTSKGHLLLASNYWMVSGGLHILVRNVNTYARDAGNASFRIITY